MRILCFHCNNSADVILITHFINQHKKLLKIVEESQYFIISKMGNNHPGKRQEEINQIWKNADLKANQGTIFLQN